VLAERQDIPAKMLTMNLAAMARNVAWLLAARHFAHRTLDCCARACRALSAMKRNLVRLLSADTDDCRAVLQILTPQLPLAVDARWPDRSFPSYTRCKVKPQFHPAYKRTAKVDCIGPNPPRCGPR